MTTATWSTAQIPAHAVRVGDRVDLHGRYTVVLDKADERAGVVCLGGCDEVGEVWQGVPSGDAVAVHVPDEPVDGYNLWRPKPGHWPSGCVCVARRHPTLDGNWETVARDETCRGHYDWNDYED